MRPAKVIIYGINREGTHRKFIHVFDSISTISIDYVGKYTQIHARIAKMLSALVSNFLILTRSFLHTAHNFPL